ncbi:adenine specific DNA methyltransferase [Helicobacter pylori NQ4099]|uniref:Adenine specific DNA methyltransferase n=2 Tax=Helicobacter pylori TaxID=210 RepID=I9QAQ9_HELPX|nr:adenine specific DNA methyltransferase [Helicobacter pylori NQ4099]EJB32341.1 adenine specific DNA methyltransferase [Helicobacter pylori NQ4076]
MFKNRLHFVAHKICDEKEELENLQKKINDTYAIIYYDLRQFKDTHLDSFLKHFVAYYYGESGKKFKERLLETEFDAYKKYDTYPYDEYEKINDLLLYLSYSSKVWYFLHTLDDEELRIEITPKMHDLLDKMRRLNALSYNAFLPLLLSLLTIQLAVRSGSERHYTAQELEGLLEYLERFGFLVYGVAGKNTAKNKWIGLAFKAIQACRFWEDKITIEDLPTLEKNFFKGEHSGLELLEENIHSKKNIEKWYKWGKALNYLLYEYELYHNPETTLNFDSSIESIEETPQGAKDENVFNIMQGVSINLFVKKAQATKPKIYYYDVYGERAEKYAFLAQNDLNSIEWLELAPRAPFYLLIPQKKRPC